MRGAGYRGLLTAWASLTLAASQLCCEGERTPGAEIDSSALAAIAPAGIVPPSDSNLTCTPVVGPADTVRMLMTLPHGPHFHITDPGGIPFFVTFSGEGGGQRRSLMAADSFSRLESLSIAPSTLKASVWVFGRDTNERVFTRAGTYRLRVGSEMESDAPKYAECLVRYVP
jgi:hypothetical protein